MGWRFPHALRATWELHASVHEPTRGTSLFQICVTAFAYISILSCFSVLSVVFSFLFFFFLLSRFLSELQRRQCRLVAPPFSAGPLAALLRRTHTQDLSLCWWIELSYTMIDRVRIQTDILRSRSGCWWKESSWQYSQVPTASYPLRDPVSPFPFESHLYWLTMSLIFFFPLFFFGQRFLTVHWQILYKIAI